MREILLATDIDGTLVGNDEATRQFNQAVIDLRRIRGLKLTYVTGRSLELFAEVQKEKSLMPPDALITAVGTEIYVNDEKLEDWPNIRDWDIKRIQDSLGRHTSLELQPKTEQRQYKLSYFVEGGDELVDEIRRQLSGLPVTVIYSMSRYLDVIPKGVNKGSALNFMAKKWNIEQMNVYACGDSGNDIDMLASSNAIIVGNATNELLNWVANYGGDAYVAKRNYANGIIEGLKHYKVL